MTMNPLTEAIGISCGVGSSLKITKIKKCMKLNGISRRVGVLGKKSFLGGGGYGCFFLGTTNEESF